MLVPNPGPWFDCVGWPFDDCPPGTSNVCAAAAIEIVEQSTNEKSLVAGLRIMFGKSSRATISAALSVKFVSMHPELRKLGVTKRVMQAVLHKNPSGTRA